MCISPDAYIAAKVTQRLLDRGVSRASAEAVGRKVARRYGDKRNSMYLAYLAGVEVGRLPAAPVPVADEIPGQLELPTSAL